MRAEVSRLVGAIGLGVVLGHVMSLLWPDSRYGVAILAVVLALALMFQRRSEV